MCFAFLILFVISNLDCMGSIRISQLQVSEHLVARGEAILTCQFNMEEEVLYSVKWYKDSEEFCRYEPNTVGIRCWPLPGVSVDRTRSSSNSITLVDLTQKTEGLYRCEVSSGPPRFYSISEEKQLSIPQFSKTIRISQLQVPNCVAEGGEAFLSCQFDMKGEPLDWVKWYIDGREFFRYSPKDNPSMRVYLINGLNVDLTRSSSNNVTLVGLTRKAEGLYRCEVAGDAPRFQTAFEEKQMSVD